MVAMAWRAQAAKGGSSGDGYPYEKVKSAKEGEQVYCHIRDTRIGGGRGGAVILWILNLWLELSQ